MSDYIVLTDTTVFKIDDSGHLHANGHKQAGETIHDLTDNLTAVNSKLYRLFASGVDCVADSDVRPVDAPAPTPPPPPIVVPPPAQKLATHYIVIGAPAIVYADPNDPAFTHVGSLQPDPLSYIVFTDAPPVIAQGATWRQIEYYPDSRFLGGWIQQGAYINGVEVVYWNNKVKTA